MIKTETEHDETVSPQLIKEGRFGGDRNVFSFTLCEVAI